MSSLKEKTTKGVIWSAIEQFSVQGVQFLMGIFIARLLLPSEYGLIAMLSIFLAVSYTFVDSGFGSALIQKQNRTQSDFSTVFYFSFAISLICYLILYLAAPYIAEFYHEPRLLSITRIISLTVIINSLGIIPRSRFSITLNFKTTAKASLLAVLISGAVGVVLAYNGYGVWALVTQALVNSFLTTLFLWIFSRWLPALEFSGESFIELFSFGSKLLVSGLLHTIYINLYTLVIGRFYNSADVGFYNRASSLAQYPSVNLIAVLNKALFPAMCLIQDNDEKLKESFNQYLRIACFIIFPIVLMLGVLAYPLIELILTDKWLLAAPLLQILCFSYMWMPIMVVNNSILSVKGRSDYFLKAEIIKKIVAVVILICTIPFGILWLCTGLVLYSLIDMIIIIYYAKKVVETGYIDQFKQLLPIVIAAFLMVGVTFCITLFFSSLWLQIIIGGVIGLLTYFAFAKILRVRELDVIRKLMLERIKS